MKYFYLLAVVLLSLITQPAWAINMCTGSNTVKVEAPNRYICGNGICETGEVCDDGENNNDYDPDKCRPDCRLYGCGDGVTDTGEECDAYLSYGETNRPNICRNNCKLPRCGDGIVDDAAPYNEECDDGNTINTDGCSTRCKIAKKPQIGIPPAAIKPIVKPGVYQHVPETKQKAPPKITPYKKRETPTRF